MEKKVRHLTRRTFLKSGSAAGAFIAIFPIWRILYPAILSSDFSTNTDRNIPDESLDKLLQIIQQYGAELGGKQVQYSAENGIYLRKAKFINHRNQRLRGGT